MGKNYKVAYTLRIEVEKTVSIHADSVEEACKIVRMQEPDNFDPLSDDLNMARITVKDEMVLDGKKAEDCEGELGIGDCSIVAPEDEELVKAMFPNG